MKSKPFLAESKLNLLWQNSSLAVHSTQTNKESINIWAYNSHIPVFQDRLLLAAAAWIQLPKCAGLISHRASISQRERVQAGKFAVTSRRELFPPPIFAREATRFQAILLRTNWMPRLNSSRKLKEICCMQEWIKRVQVRHISPRKEKHSSEDVWFLSPKEMHPVRLLTPCSPTGYLFSTRLWVWNQLYKGLAGRG